MYVPTVAEYDRAARKVWEVACRPLLGGGRQAVAASRGPVIVNRATPAGPTSPPVTERVALIQKASHEYQAEIHHLGRLTSRSVWVCQAFRDRGLPLPSDQELIGLPADDAPAQCRTTSFCSTADRLTLIHSASREYDAGPSSLPNLCSRSAFVQDAFRQRGLQLPSDQELIGLPPDDAPAQSRTTRFCSAADRLTLIHSASREYDTLSRPLQGICGRSAWVRDAFRQAGLALPRNAELSGLPLD